MWKETFSRLFATYILPFVPNQQKLWDYEVFSKNKKDCFVRDIYNEKVYGFEPGDIVRIKPGAKVWWMDEKKAIVFKEPESYIQIRMSTFDKRVVYGYKIEKNLFGPIKFNHHEHELMVSSSILDFTEIYTEHNFCNDRFIWIDYVYNQQPAIS